MSYLTIDLAIDHVPAVRVRRARSTTRRTTTGRVFAATLCFSLAFCLAVPSSEIRAKAFKLALIAKSIKTRVLS